MALLKDDNYDITGCEIEYRVKNISDESANVSISFRYGGSFPNIEVNQQTILRSDIKSLFYKLSHLEECTNHYFETQEPGLTIYCIAEKPRDFVPEQLYKLIFVLDAGEFTKYIGTETGPACCLMVTKKQLETFYQQILEELNS